MTIENSKIKSIFAPLVEMINEPFVYKIGGTTYEVTTHFNTEGKETVLEQFEALLTEHKMI